MKTWDSNLFPDIFLWARSMIRMFDDTVAVMQPAASRGRQAFLSMFSDSNLNLDVSLELWQNQNQQRVVWLLQNQLVAPLRPSSLSLLRLSHEVNSCFCFHVECEAAQKNRKCAERSGPADMLESLQAVSSREHTALPHSSHFRPEANQRQIFVFALNRKTLSVFTETTLCCFSRNPQELRVSNLKLDSVKKQSEWESWTGPEEEAGSDLSLISSEFWASVWLKSSSPSSHSFFRLRTQHEASLLSSQLNMNVSRVQSSWEPLTEARTQTRFSLWSANNLWPGLQFCSQSASSSSLCCSSTLLIQLWRTDGRSVRDWRFIMLLLMSSELRPLKHPVTEVRLRTSRTSVPSSSFTRGKFTQASSSGKFHTEPSWTELSRDGPSVSESAHVGKNPNRDLTSLWTTRVWSQPSFLSTSESLTLSCASKSTKLFVLYRPRVSWLSVIGWW